MGSTDIGYGSSMSADTNGKEGDYYLWKKDQMVEAVGEVGNPLQFSAETGKCPSSSSIHRSRYPR